MRGEKYELLREKLEEDKTRDQRFTTTAKSVLHWTFLRSVVSKIRMA